MSRFKWAALAVALAVIISGSISFGLGVAGTAYSQGTGFIPVTNTSGRPLPVIDGNSGLPVYFEGQPWVIEPGQTFYTHVWQGQPRFYYGGLAYHYIGSVGGSRFQFFLVEDWIVNAGGVIPSTLNPLPQVTPTPTPIPATATPAFPFVQSGGVSYLPNCGLTQIKGRIVNPDGIGRGGVRVRVWSGDWSTVSNESNSNGDWDVLLDGRPKPGLWNVQVFDNQSPVVTVETNTADCGPNGSGRQVAIVDFRKTSY